MAMRNWTGAINGDLSDGVNWDSGLLPGTGDQAVFDTAYLIGNLSVPSSGTLTCSYFSLGAGLGINGGTYNCNCANPYVRGNIYAGIFNGQVLLDTGGAIWGGTFNAHAATNNAMFFGGTFHSTVAWSNSSPQVINNCIFSVTSAFTNDTFSVLDFGNCTVAGTVANVNGSTISGGTFNGVVTNSANITGGIFKAQTRASTGGTIAAYPATAFTDDPAILTFSNNGSVATVTGFSSIGNGAIIIPATDGLGHNVVAIGVGAFDETDNVHEVTSLDMSGATNLLTIGQSAFASCTGLTGSLTIPASVTSIVYNAFSYCTGFTGSLSLPTGLLTIGDSVFEGCLFTGSLVIPNTVTTIGWAAFNDCSGFTGDLVIPDSVIWAGSHTFEGCSGLNGTLTLSQNMTVVGTDFVTGANGLHGAITIPNSVVTIESNAFASCQNFISLSLGSSVADIQQSAFSSCTGLGGSLTLPSSMRTIGDAAFYACNQLSGLVLNNGLLTIGSNAFSGCTDATGDFVIPDSVTSIGASAFTDFHNNSGGTLTIGTGVTTIGQGAFQYGGWTGTLTIPDNVIGDGGAFGATKFTSVIVGNGITSIRLYGFGYCTNMTSISLPQSCTNIDSIAFLGTALSSITIRPNITTPAASIVKKGTVYGTNNTLTGTLAGGEVIVPF